MEEYVQIISNLGFPIFAFCLMYKLHRDTVKIIDRNTVAIQQLRIVIEREIK